MYHTGIVMTQQSEINEKNYVTPQALKYNESFIYTECVKGGSDLLFIFNGAPCIFWFKHSQVLKI